MSGFSGRNALRGVGAILTVVVGVAVAGLGIAPPAEAQMAVTAKAGGYLPVSDAYTIPSAVEDFAVTRDAEMAVGGAIEWDWALPGALRAGGEYVTGTRVSLEGVSADAVVDGSLLMLSADLVLRPLPRMVVQPYVMGGIGYKRESFRLEDGAGAALPESYGDYLVHAGLGADMQLGGIAVFAEVSDYFDRQQLDDRDAAFRHDVFASVGVRLGGS